MIYVTILGWLSVAGVLLAYASGRLRLYNWTNVFLCVPVALPALVAHAYPSATISLAFGCIAVWHVWRHRKAGAR